MDTTAAIWATIRSTRADRPGHAKPANCKRCGVYLAALEQFEQLMRAAADVGYAARPLPLYYALNQAGRAIAAAHVEQPWMLQGHGLRVDVCTDEVLRSAVDPDPQTDDAFSRLCSTGGHRLAEATTVGELYASLPDLARGNLPAYLGRGPLRVVDEYWSAPPPTEQHDLGFPVQLTVAGFERVDPDESDVEKAFARELSHYPTAGGWERVATAPVFDGKRWLVDLRWPPEEQKTAGYDARRAVIAPESRTSGERWLRPALNGGGESLSVFLTWWALLYALSVVARYYPREWAKALRVTNVFAVPLEIAMDIALEAIPHYVLEALSGEPIRLP